MRRIEIKKVLFGISIFGIRPFEGQEQLETMRIGGYWLQRNNELFGDDAAWTWGQERDRTSLELNRAG